LHLLFLLLIISLGKLYFKIELNPISTTAEKPPLFFYFSKILNNDFVVLKNRAFSALSINR